MRFELAVFGEVARDHQYVGSLLHDFREHSVQNALALGKDLAVAVERVLIIFRVLDEFGRKNVDVGQNCDVQRLFVCRAFRLRLLFLCADLQPLREQPDEQGRRQQEGEQRRADALCFACHKILQKDLYDHYSAGVVIKLS